MVNVRVVEIGGDLAWCRYPVQGGGNVSVWYQGAVRFSAGGTHTGQWLHFAPTGKSIRYTGVTLVRIAGDKIIEHQTWSDKAGLMEQVTGGNRKSQTPQKT